MKRISLFCVYDLSRFKIYSRNMNPPESTKSLVIFVCEYHRKKGVLLLVHLVVVRTIIALPLITILIFYNIKLGNKNNVAEYYKSVVEMISCNMKIIAKILYREMYTLVFIII